ncbi:MAG: lysine exporter LysO family protein [Desulfovermiculus sp.]
MKGSCVLLGAFVLGIFAGWGRILPEEVLQAGYEMYILFALLACVGIGVGADKRSVQSLLRMNVPGLLLPSTVVVGSLLGAGCVAVIFGIGNLREGLAVGAGFGYYSLSSILITQLHGEELGVVALLSNVFREVITLALAPVLYRYWGRLAPIACGGATSMDTTLPVIHRLVGTRLSLLSVVNGIVLSLLVPVLVPLLLA